MRHTLAVSYTGGFVFYLNGEEIVRRGLPDGPISHQTPALGNGSVTSEEIDLSAYIYKLPRGSYLAAVEVHPRDANGNRFVWEAKLVSERPTPLIVHPDG